MLTARIPDCRVSVVPQPSWRSLLATRTHTPRFALSRTLTHTGVFGCSCTRARGTGRVTTAGALSSLLGGKRTATLSIRLRSLPLLPPPFTSSPSLPSRLAPYDPRQLRPSTTPGRYQPPQKPSAVHARPYLRRSLPYLRVPTDLAVPFAKTTALTMFARFP